MGSEPDAGASPKSLWRRLVAHFEHAVVLTLIGLLMIVVATSTFELGWLLLKDLSSLGKMALDAEEMFELFGFFLLVLIGLELIATLKAYMGEGVVHVEVVLEVALIAIAQKIIILDSSRTGWPTVLALAAMILALSVAFWLVRAHHRRGGSA